MRESCPQRASRTGKPLLDREKASVAAPSGTDDKREAKGKSGGERTVLPLDCGCGLFVKNQKCMSKAVTVTTH